MTSRRWLFYAVNGEGIGHLNRLLALARQLRQREPASEFLFLTTSEAASLCWQEGFASVKIPSPGSAARTGLQEATILKMLQTSVPAMLGWYAPQVVVVDTFPSGYRQELTPIFSWPVQRIFIYREMRPQFARHVGFQATLEHYHRVIVPHSPELCELESTPAVPLDFVGHMLLRSREEACGREEARRRLGLPEEAFVVYVGFGGGGDQENGKLRDWVLAQAARFPSYHFACALGPLDASGQFATKATNVSSFRYWPLAECWSAFDGAVSAAGYNSTTELLHHGVPTIWVPLEKVADDQHRRAERVSQRGAGWLANPYDTPALATALAFFKDTARREDAANKGRALVASNGAVVAADHIVRSLGVATN